MDLDGLKREIQEEVEREASERLNGQARARQEREERLREVQSSMKEDLPKLRLLEGCFWDCAEKFSDIIKKEIRKGSGRRRLFGVIGRSSIKTRDHFKEPCHPRLSVFFDYGENVQNVVEVEASKGILLFRAEHYYFTAGNLKNEGVRETYAGFSSELSLAGFKKEEAEGWLEEQFVNYYRAMNR